MCLLTNNIQDYYFVSQGKTTIPNVDDGEELTLTDVSQRRGTQSLSREFPDFFCVTAFSKIIVHEKL